MTIIGIDNGQSGTIGIMRDGQAVCFVETPTMDTLHYGKKGKISQRLDRGALRNLLIHHADINAMGGEVKARAYVERPFTGGAMMINAMLSARSFYEATIITLEDLGIGYEVVDSGEWQKALLGAVKGSAELKKASMLRGIQLFPQYAEAIRKHGDADGLLISYHYARHV